MKNAKLTLTTAACVAMVMFQATGILGQDWPQWRGANRDGKASDFKAPKSWPKELTKKWKFSGDSPGYASPVLMTIGGTRLVIAVAERRIVAVNVADGKLAWETPFVASGMGGYNASTPIVDGQTLIYAGSGRGTKAVKFEKMGEGIVARELWSNAEKSVQFNSPVLKDGLVYGLTQGNELFCVDTKNGQLAWSAPAGPAGGGGGAPGGPGGNRPPVPGAFLALADPPPAAPGEPGRPRGPGGPGGPGGNRGPGGPGGPGGRGGGGRGGGYGSIVDAGSVLLALTPSSELIVFQPGAKAFTEITRIKVAESQTHAHPVVSGNRIFIKDKDSVTLWMVE